MQYEGFILIPDITGYTSYLTRSELEHAQGTLTELMELLIDHTPTPLVVAQLEGDAVMSYGLSEGFVSGQTFIEMIEETSGRRTGSSTISPKATPWGRSKR